MFAFRAVTTKTGVALLAADEEEFE